MRKLLVFILLSSMLAVIVGAVCLAAISKDLPDVDTLRDVKLQVPLRVYSSDGKLISEFGDQRRIPIKLSQVPPMFINAVLATEDRRFFQHSGVDARGLLRAAVHVATHSDRGQGGSTITMQVARNFFLSRQKTYLRKLSEILLALKIERELSKNEILELYLNKIFFGKRAYGIAAAADVYYGKPVNKLTLAEMAMIAGLPKAPSSINPITNPEAAEDRRRHVLERMLSYNFINQKQFDQAVKAPIGTRYHAPEAELYAPYVAEMVRQRLVAKLGDDVYTNGYSVYTTIDSKVQSHANAALIRGLLEYDMRHGYRGPEKRTNSSSIATILKSLDDLPDYAGIKLAVVSNVGENSAQAVLQSKATVNIPWSGLSWARRDLGDLKMGPMPNSAHDILKVGDIIRVVQSTDGVWRLSQKPEIEGALVAIRPDDGAILALVGGYDFEQSPFNRVIQAERQPGSNFKPFIYSAALENGFTAASIVNDAPIVIDNPGNDQEWRPQNSNRQFLGPTPFRIGLIESRNLVSIRILQSVGIDKTIDFLTRFGFEKDKLPNGLSLALGTLSLSPLELASGYAVLANGGYKVEPYYIDHVNDNQKEVFRFTPLRVCRQSGQVNCATTTNVAPEAIPAQNAFIMTDILKDTIKRGTAQAAAALNRADLAGKTGTTNDQRDAWFSGYNADLAVTAWVGFDDHKRSTGEYGAKAALPIWMEFMRHTLAGKPLHDQPQPPGIVTMRIDPTTGLLARNDQANAVTEIFREDDAPKQFSPETPLTPESGGAAVTPNGEPLF